MNTTRGLSLRDGVATLLTGFALLVAAAVTNGWDWPVVGSSYRIGGLVLFVVGVAACAVGGESFASRPPDAFLAIGRWLSALASVLLLAILVFGTAPFLVGLSALILVLWLLATGRHLVGGIRSAAMRPTLT